MTLKRERKERKICVGCCLVFVEKDKVWGEGQLLKKIIIRVQDEGGGEVVRVAALGWVELALVKLALVIRMDDH